MSQPGADTTTPKAKPHRSPLRRWSLHLLRLGVILYAIVALAACSLQRQLVFPGSMAPNAVGRFAPPEGATPLTLHTADGTQVAAMFYRAFEADRRLTDRPADHPTILYFYGNGQVMAYAQYEVDLFRRCGANVLVGDYPGYGLSKGQASEEGCYGLSEALWNYASQSPEVDPNRIVIVGWSLGGAVAIRTAHQHPPAGLMTVSTFTSMDEMASTRYWFLPTSLLLKYHFPSLERMGQIRCPSIFVHGDSDTFIPHQMTARLRDASPAAWKRHLLIPEAGHNDVFATGYPQIRAALRELLDQVNQAQGPATGTDGVEDTWGGETISVVAAFPFPRAHLSTGRLR